MSVLPVVPLIAPEVMDALAVITGTSRRALERRRRQGWDPHSDPGAFSRAEKYARYQKLSQKRSLTEDQSREFDQLYRQLLRSNAFHGGRGLKQLQKPPDWRRNEKYRDKPYSDEIARHYMNRDRLEELDAKKELTPAELSEYRDAWDDLMTWHPVEYAHRYNPRGHVNLPPEEKYDEPGPPSSGTGELEPNDPFHPPSQAPPGERMLDPVIRSGPRPRRTPEERDLLWRRLKGLPKRDDQASRDEFDRRRLVGGPRQQQPTGPPDQDMKDNPDASRPGRTGGRPRVRLGPTPKKPPVLGPDERKEPGPPPGREDMQDPLDRPEKRRAGGTAPPGRESMEEPPDEDLPPLSEPPPGYLPNDPRLPGLPPPPEGWPDSREPFPGESEDDYVRRRMNEYEPGLGDRMERARRDARYRNPNISPGLESGAPDAAGETEEQRRDRYERYRRDLLDPIEREFRRFREGERPLPTPPGVPGQIRTGVGPPRAGKTPAPIPLPVPGRKKKRDEESGEQRPIGPLPGQIAAGGGGGGGAGGGGTGGGGGFSGSGRSLYDLKADEVNNGLIPEPSLYPSSAELHPYSYANRFAKRHYHRAYDSFLWE